VAAALVIEAQRRTSYVTGLPAVKAFQFNWACRPPIEATDRLSDPVASRPALAPLVAALVAPLVAVLVAALVAPLVLLLLAGAGAAAPGGSAGARSPLAALAAMGASG
jgi:hypothetical protein